MNTTETALVLQGGAALGAYEYGAIRYLYENGIRPKIVTGVSIGAFNAGVLGGSVDPIESLDRLWRDYFAIGGLLGKFLDLLPSNNLKQLVQLFGVPNVYMLNPALLLYPLMPATSIYNVSPVKNTLQKLIDFDVLNGPDAPHVSVNAMNLQTGDLKYFDNINGRITLEHILASGSIAPLAPATVIENPVGQDTYYWDGGFYNNTPLSRAINLLEEAPDPSDGVCKREIIIIELFPKVNEHIPQNLREVIGRIVEVVGSSKLEHDMTLMDKTSHCIDLVKTVDDMIDRGEGISEEAAKFIRSLPGWKILDAHKKIDRQLRITPEYELAPLSPLDFSREVIEYRIESGYRDAERALEEG